MRWSLVGLALVVTWPAQALCGEPRLVPRALAFSRDGQSLAAGCAAGMAHTWLRVALGAPTPRCSDVEHVSRGAGAHHAGSAAPAPYELVVVTARTAAICGWML